MRGDKKSEKRRKRKILLETILSIAILLAIFIGGLVGYYGSKVNSFLDNISTEENQSTPGETDDRPSQITNTEPFAALILGTDIEESGQARTDTIILVTVNPEKESIKMISIPRDTLIELPNGTMEKINAAYPTGGARLSKKVISDMFNIPIDFYAILDYNGLIELVDAIGGITVNSELEFTQNNYADRNKPINIKKGIQTLNGEEALGYARMRKKDPRGDFGRQDRQKDVVQAILEELVSFNTLTNLTQILDSVQPYLKTNATSNEILDLATGYYKTLNDIEQLSLNGEAGDAYFPHYGLTVYVWEPYEESLWEISEELRDHLGLYGDIKLVDDSGSEE